MASNLYTRSFNRILWSVATHTLVFTITSDEEATSSPTRSTSHLTARVWQWFGYIATPVAVAAPACGDPHLACQASFRISPQWPIFHRLTVYAVRSSLDPRSARPTSPCS